MPILNLSKAKKEEEKKEDVPDELPSLPPDEENKEEVKEDEKKADQTEEKKGAEEETTDADENKEDTEKKDEEELAPDELPPVEKPEENKIEVAYKNIDTIQTVKKEVQPKILDERLFFSKLIKKLNDGMPIEEIENEINSRDIISALDENLSHTKKKEIKSDKEGEIKSEIGKLQALERKWNTLKKELEEKQAEFESTEKSIRDKTEHIKSIFNDIDEIRKQF